VETVSDNIRQVKKTFLESRTNGAEHWDKEERRNNVILYKLFESKAVKPDDRNKDDIAAYLQLFNNCLQAGIAEEDLVHVFRLGRRGENDVPRPLMVQFASYTFRNSGITSAVMETVQEPETPVFFQNRGELKPLYF